MSALASGAVILTAGRCSGTSSSKALVKLAVELDSQNCIDTLPSTVKGGAGVKEVPLSVY